MKEEQPLIQPLNQKKPPGLGLGGGPAKFSLDLSKAQRRNQEDNGQDS